jgi:hypothetical protein
VPAGHAYNGHMSSTATTATGRPTRAAFKKQIEAMIVRSNPGATIGEWTRFSDRNLTWADGSRAVWGWVKVTQEGYRPSEMMGTWGSDGMGWSVS